MQAATLAVGAMYKQVVAVTDGFSEGSFIDVTLSCDHRVIDGAVGALWLQEFRSYLEDPSHELYGEVNCGQYWAEICCVRFVQLDAPKRFLTAFRRWFSWLLRSRYSSEYTKFPVDVCASCPARMPRSDTHFHISKRFANNVHLPAFLSGRQQFLNFLCVLQVSFLLQSCSPL